jgi:hypothetical protein
MIMLIAINVTMEISTRRIRYLPKGGLLATLQFAGSEA